ncbi:hypothetical protein KEH56_33480 [Burkholderia cenocepacia]|uniref:hypothetical protein n=1 Tax=Burkholderia cenocepacia TaxID=95486 RepID=UPI001BAB6F8D|nr:hypothetical protein [Burkholderia cenocepacia]QUN44124.1 hypothetical protein KEH56_33480 [Burkholderia cenocepacia]QUO24422.1 hypothetical protein KEH57_12735 [Burkholderia cenocepacia]
MAKCSSSVLEFTKFNSTVRTSDQDVEITKRICESPAGACSTRAEQLRGLTTLISGGGFETFDNLDPDIKASILWLVEDLANDVANLAALSVEAGIARRAASEVQHG